jgi:spore maturation protein CgeB
MTFNTAFSGTEAALQVKGRVVESALAGALLLETKGAPTSYWFRPGVDYLEYETTDDAVSLIRQLTHEPEQTQALAMSMRSRILAEHTPAHFWARILERIGMKVAA